jgi:hypothetical protein
MRPAISGRTRPAASNASHRDKRYAAPNLLVDLLDAVHETPLWSPTQLILKNFEGDLVVDETFTGALSFEDHQSCGLFEARALRVDPARKMVGAEFLWISKPGSDLMGLMAERRKADGLDQNPTMRITITQRTINWSLTGMLLERYRGDLQAGQPFRGMIRIEKAQEPGVFSASVIRADHERHTLALKFQELPAGSFALLEAAIKKSNAN